MLSDVALTIWFGKIPFCNAVYDVCYIKSKVNSTGLMFEINCKITNMLVFNSYLSYLVNHKKKMHDLSDIEVIQYTSTKNGFEQTIKLYSDRL